VPIVLKSGSLNLLETSGPVQECNGIALPLPCSGYDVLTILRRGDTIFKVTESWY
jgi:hypothetical protein